MENGLQRRMRHAPIAPPRKGPFAWIAWMVYREQFGVNLQVGGNSGETNLW